jgi:hypothetical protein
MKKFVLWSLAVIITLAAVVYQRRTGPTYPKRVKIEIDNKEYKLKLLRSHGGTSEAPIELAIDADIQASLFYKFFPVHEGEEWHQVPFLRDGKNLLAKLPNQPAAGKLMYYINITDGDKNIELQKDSPVVIRFKGEVPQVILIPHVILMFLAMLLANVSGLFAIGKVESYKKYTFITFGLLAIGGMILGPLVQYYAFGDLWTGVPYGWDLTDNKTLIAFIFWIIAVVGQIKKERPYLTVIASVVILIVYSIPHSMFGSELDRASGDITQGFIQMFPFII